MAEEIAVDTALRQRLATLTPQQRAVFERRRRERAAAVEPEPGTPQPTGPTVGRRRRRPDSTMEFSVFFFSGDGSSVEENRYDLLLECARIADRAGFAGIWVPERHFVDFGGLYPNPSVLAAALAVVTERIQIRAGSVALPLHHPARIAEEWSVVDNLSRGRVAISAASGWHPDDFVLAPGDGAQTYRDRKAVMFDRLATVQRLWAGETVEVPGVTGTPTAVRTLPRPIQPRLPVWVSSQGSTDTFVQAGRAGANLLTGLVAQQPEQVRTKIAAYRKARADAGYDPETGVVTAMVHTFLGSDLDEVREVVRRPLIDYLGTFLRQQDSTDSGYAVLSEAEREVMLSATFDRYFDHLALLGTAETGESFVEDLVDLDVDEVACLVDFGVAPDLVIEGLTHLTELKNRYQHPRGTA
ncbi:MupA/Atu3671 family FMN-dependent luciferase-like monooxygenase [Micromonospora sp. NPDC000207]|uniref:MupA/Atu3671 family FMN-dependent luciferase-like monooxygenase n=1 Tax=Micromonospora sp. NPDC000207 TaxID=3154246 RepID=UPI00331B5811